MVRLARAAAEPAATAAATKPAADVHRPDRRTTRTAARRAHDGLRLAGKETFALRFLRASLRARRIASAFSRALFSEGFS